MKRTRRRIVRTRLRPRLRIWSWGVAIAIALPFLHPAAARADVLACPAPDSVPNTQLVAGNPGEYVDVQFHVPRAAEVEIWGVVGVRAGLDGTLAEERSMAAWFLEKRDGTAVGSPNWWFSFADGTELTTNQGSAFLATVAGLCGSSAGGGVHSLKRGDYRLVLFGTTDTGGAAGAALSRNVVVTNVSRGPMQRISESDMTCAEKLRIVVAEVTTERLRDCTMTMSAPRRSYRAVFTNRWPDGNHLAYWTAPNGTDLDYIKVIDAAAGDPGIWKLNVPTWDTPLNSPYTDPPEAREFGVFGAFAGVP